MSLAEGPLPCGLCHDGFDITYPPVNSRRLWKHYLRATWFAGGNNSIDILLMVMKSAIFVWYLGQHVKLNTTGAVELCPLVQVEGGGWGSVEMGRGNINRDNLCWHFLKRWQLFSFSCTVYFEWCIVHKFFRKSHFWTFMAAQVIYAYRWWCRL